MKFENGIYEQLVTKIVSEAIEHYQNNNFYIKTTKIQKAEASQILANHFMKVIKFALDQINGQDSVKRQIELLNKIIKALKNELQNQDFDENIVDIEAKIVNAVFNKTDLGVVDFDNHTKEITPYTGLTQSELFTGSNAGISLDSEIKKEILSSDKIYLLVSFIKWSGIRIFEKELRKFTSSGKKLKVITTTYMGATDHKAISFLASLPNTEIKISYNTSNERLHAKSYLFFRNSGFHTGYIGSSNISKSALTSGLEWNLKVTTAEISHIIKKFEKTFETYWEDAEFELFDTTDQEKLQRALKSANTAEQVPSQTLKRAVFGHFAHND